MNLIERKNELFPDLEFVYHTGFQIVYNRVSGAQRKIIANIIDGNKEPFDKMQIHTHSLEVNGVPCATACSFSNTGTRRHDNQDRVVIDKAGFIAVVDAYGNSGSVIADLVTPEFVNQSCSNVGSIISGTYQRMKSIAPTLPNPPANKQKGGIACGVCRIEMQAEKMILRYHRIGDVTIIIIKKNANPKRTVDQVNAAGEVTNTISADEDRAMMTVTESEQIEVGDIIIIGSDGVLKDRDTQRLIDEIEGKNVHEIARHLANTSRHGRDNVSAAVVEITQIPPPQNAREDGEGDGEGEDIIDRNAWQDLMSQQK